MISYFSNFSFLVANFTGMVDLLFATFFFVYRGIPCYLWVLVVIHLTCNRINITNKKYWFSQRLRACDADGIEFGPVELPKGLKPVGPNVDEGTLLQSVATALHVTSQPVTGQTASKTSLTANSGVYVNPEQPLMHSINITEDDIRRQEDRVTSARKKLQDALKEWLICVEKVFLLFCIWLYNM